MGKLEGKIALITGASRGIGRSIALRFAQEGAFVIVHYGKRRHEAEAVVQQITQNGGNARAIGANLSTFDGIQDLFAAMDYIIQERTGDNLFDILVKLLTWKTQRKNLLMR